MMQGIAEFACVWQQHRVGDSERGEGLMMCAWYVCVYSIFTHGVLLYGGQGASLNGCVCAEVRWGSDSGGHMCVYWTLGDY